jgi:hypothetical protein
LRARKTTNGGALAVARCRVRAAGGNVRGTAGRLLAAAAAGARRAGVRQQL